LAYLAGVEQQHCCQLLNKDYKMFILMKIPLMQIVSNIKYSKDSVRASCNIEHMGISALHAHSLDNIAI
jgi:hypothetical protein